MEKKVTPAVVDKTLELASLMLAFGRTLRATHHEDGERRETDSDHTVMLGVMACAYADVFAPQLDKGKIAQYALVHDLVEVYAGDTVTFGKLDGSGDKEKEERETAALVRIREEFDVVYPWIGKTIEEYESLNSYEARFVKVIDKVMPKLVHILNKGATVRALNHDDKSTKEFHDYQFNRLTQTYGADQAEAMELLKCVNEAVQKARKDWDDELETACT
ncbi:MAG: HD domain-containing protein [Patescibacteria group bacterium]